MTERIVKFMQGNEACVEGALYAGCRFFSGYPITPSSEIAEEMSARLPWVGGTFIQMEDEIGAMAAVIGASLGGTKSMTATSGPGFSLKQENIGFACMTEIPCVIVNVQRGGPSTGLPTLPSQSDYMQARWGTHGDHEIIVLSPSSVKETLTETIRAFNLSEKFRIPVVLLTDEIVGHMREKVVLPEPGEIKVCDRKKPDCVREEYLPYDSRYGDVPPMAAFGDGYRYHLTGLNHDASGFPTQDATIIQREQERMENKILRHWKDIVKSEELYTDDCEILVISFGSTARAAKSAVMRLRRRSKIKVGMLRPLTVWPFPSRRVRQLAKQVKAIVVPEMNMGQMRLVVRAFVGTDVQVVGVNLANGDPIPPSMILKRIQHIAYH